MHIVTLFLKHNRNISPTWWGGYVRSWGLMEIDSNLRRKCRWHITGFTLQKLPSWSLPGLCYSFSLFLQSRQSNYFFLLLFTNKTTFSVKHVLFSCTNLSFINKHIWGSRVWNKSQAICTAIESLFGSFMKLTSILLSAFLQFLCFVGLRNAYQWQFWILHSE